MNDKSSKPKITKILTALMGDTLPAETEERIRHWLARDEKREEREAALDDIFSNGLAEDPAPDSRVMRSYRQISRKLGFPKEKSGMRLGSMYIRRIAAVVVPLIAVVGIAALLVNRKADNAGLPSADYITVSTAADTQKKVTLPDGSTVWLNENSSISYPEGFEQSREVDLDGEAFFSVVKSAGREFSVRGGGILVRVLGTKFNVNASDRQTQTEVTLEEGCIEIEAGGNLALLSPGKKAVYHTGSKQLDTVNAQGGEHSWLLDVKTITDQPLRNLLAQVADYYNMEVMFRNFADDGELYTVSFEKDDPIEVLMRPLCMVCDTLSYEIDGNTIIVDNITEN